MTLGEDRIFFPGNKWTFRRLAAKDHFGMIISGSAFGAHQVIPIVNTINMWRLYPHRVFGSVHSSIHNEFFLSHHSFILVIKFIHTDGAMAIPKRFSFWWITIINDVGLIGTFIKK